MTKASLAALLVCVGAINAASHAQDSALDYPSVWRCDRPKFNWYCDQEEQAQDHARQPPSKQPASALPAASSPPATAKRLETKDIRTAAQLRAELKRREDLAVMTPSDENLKDYLQLWQLTQDKGAVFADNWRRVVWQTPELDYSLKRPINNAAIKTFDAGRRADADEQLRTLAKDHGLIFFFRSDCPYCKAMAPVLQTLAHKYGLEVLGVSIDGGSLPEFPNPRDGVAQAAAWGIERVPALFIGSKRTGDKAAIGFGAMAFTDIVDRIFVLTKTQPGQSF